MKFRGPGGLFLLSYTEELCLVGRYQTGPLPAGKVEL
jgi:hypothetical protein